jgi:formylglycine-generating enzyme required for sulfatase activity
MHFEFRASGLPELKYSVDLSPGRKIIDPLKSTNPIEGSIRSAWTRLCYPALSTYLDCLCSIPGGRFEMGGSKNINEQPVHPVQLSPFRLGATPVTVSIWREYCVATGTAMPEAPKWGWLDDHPIVNVSWHDIMGADGNGGFCAWASEVAGFRVMLPTEAQWEYACRAGQSGLEYPWGNEFDLTKLWCSKAESGDTKRTAPIVRSAYNFTNGFGLTDMVGNVWEWCLDYYLAQYLVPSTTKVVQRHRSVRASGIAGVLGKMVDETFEEQVTEYIEVSDPSGPTDGKVRCVRGGSWSNDSPGNFRCAFRLRYFPDGRNNDFGFRLSAGPS